METLNWEAEVESAILHKHIITAQMVRNAMKSGLTPQEVVDGIRLTHEEYIDLVQRALDHARLDEGEGMSTIWLRGALNEAFIKLRDMKITISEIDKILNYIKEVSENHT